MYGGDYCVVARRQNEASGTPKAGPVGIQDTSLMVTLQFTLQHNGLCCSAEAKCESRFEQRNDEEGSGHRHQGDLVEASGFFEHQFRYRAR